MNQPILAFDFDGTIASDGQVPNQLVDLFQRAHSSSYPIFLVTGRLFQNASIETILPYLAGIVWENGAVLEDLTPNGVSLPFGKIPDQFLKDLKQTGIELIAGMAIAATWVHHQHTVDHIIRQHQYIPTIEYNKDALMILPPNANKASGLKWLLTQNNVSPENLVAFGDGENDRALLAMANIAVAVQDAVPSLREMAHVVSKQPGPAGVAEILQNLLNGKIF